MTVKRWLALIAVLLLTGLGFYFYSYYQRARQYRSAESARLSAANLFLAGQYTPTATVTVTATLTSTATATNTALQQWSDSRYPLFSQVTQKYSATIQRVRYLTAQEAFVAAPGSAPSTRVELEQSFAHTITTADGMQVDQMFDKQTGELTSERWQDPVLGKVVRTYDPGFETASLRAETEGTKIDFIPIPRDQTEYLKVQERDQGFVSLLEGNIRTEYWANLGQNRFVEFRDGQPSRQWRRVGENRFQEVDESGHGLSFYRINQEEGGIELAE